MDKKEKAIKTINEDGSITYKIKKTAYVIQQDKRNDKVWYLFKLTPTKARTITEGKKAECIHYAEHILDLME